VFDAVKSPFLAPFDRKFSLKDFSTEPPKKAPSKDEAKESLKENVERLAELQQVLYAHDRWSILLIFQAMDAAGKDGTIRAVLSGVNPVGCQVSAFKAPTAEELDHDFLWRTARRLPERGRIGVFNRSYYEEVLVVRVHPEYIGGQRIPDPCLDMKKIWKERYDSIREHEQHLARNGTAILKFFLNVSKDEQRKRFLSRLEEPEKNWKFAMGDMAEREHWDAYQDAYEEAIAATSRPHAPWYVIPADKKSYMRLVVSDIIVKALESLDLKYPEVAEKDRARFAEMRTKLENGKAESRDQKSEKES